MGGDKGTILIFFEPDVNVDAKKLIFTGVLDNPRTALTTDIDLCDYIILDTRDLQLETPRWKSYKPEHLAKTIVIDYRDPPHVVLKIPCLKYFKRSVVCQKTKKLISYKEREVIPLSYSLKWQYRDRAAGGKLHEHERDIDISVFIHPAYVRHGVEYAPDSHPGTYRDGRAGHRKVARFIKDSFSDLKIHVGICGQKGGPGRGGFQEKYYNKMLQSKIVVTCNPHRWEGDHRTWEALSSGALVVVDRMLTPTVNPLLDGKHVVFYDLDDLAELKRKLLFYLNTPSARERIAKDGTEFALKYHTASSRVDEILSHLEVSTA